MFVANLNCKHKKLRTTEVVLIFFIQADRLGILPVITIVLEILPYGAVCNFANPEGEVLRETFSNFDLTPFGYANLPLF